ncbi:SPOR domain-containing protein [Aestuariivita boseongensis]|uniref:SPOR domain-containing protein n=1 Tax=Aestuariivita boseongensis TaxID=1470562 RepID=UPI0009E3EC40|nr:SPOR domain-containing protein [Aestuariivita boseongensis]
MADIEYTADVDQTRAAPAQGGGLGFVANLAGATISLGLLVGVGIWGYKLMVRDVSGVPVVRALEGPMRIQPENPGGRPADHQGLAVNAVAAAGSAAAPADTLILAPRPLDLSEEDVPTADLSRPAARPEAAPVAPSRPATQKDEIEALVAQITENAAARSAPDPASQPSAPEIVAPEPVVVEASAAAAAANDATPAVARDVPGVAVSLRPQLRPAGGPPETVTQAALQSAEPALDIDPAEVPTGTRVVQLGAYESGEIARTEWDRLAVRFGDYMQGKRRIVQQATSGGRTFYRLRVHGFDDLSDARRFCSALVAEGADCIPVVTR